MTALQSIPGIGKTFQADFERIGIFSVEQLQGAEPEKLYQLLQAANERESHKTSRNYLYVIRLAVYYANGGREPHKLKWNYWKEPSQ